jgi:predicted metal-binding membrane protein
MDPMASSKTIQPPEAKPVIGDRSASALSALERVLRHDRAILVVAIAVIATLAWTYLLFGASTSMSPFTMSTWRFPLPAIPAVTTSEWTPAYAILMLLMWWTMMIAMMLPSATPLVLLHARVTRQNRFRQDRRLTLGHSGIFLAGYLLVWLGFSGVATALQWRLEAFGLLDGMTMWSSSTQFSAGFLIAAGLYQLTPFKAICLRYCRSPIVYLSSHWREGNLGALRMGLAHGAFCLGCCWLLMSLLFVGGAMNLVWIAGLSIVVLIEKLVPAGQWLGRFFGVLLLIAGISLSLTV